MNCRRVMSAFVLVGFASLPMFSQVIIEPNGNLSFSVCLTPADDNARVSLSTSVRPYSGEHEHHDAGRPDGVTSPANGWRTDCDGCIDGTFSAVVENLAGEYEITATADGYGGDSLEVWVLHQPYMQNLPPHYAYQLKGQNSAHPNNHYGSFNAVYRIQQICIQFYNETALRAGVNDMSLPWGGMFDIGPPYGSYWNTPHGTHMAGLNADIPFQYLGTLQQRVRFREIADACEGNSEIHNGNHYHLRFPN